MDVQNQVLGLHSEYQIAKAQMERAKYVFELTHQIDFKKP
jgi:hypothetical protein